MPLPDEIAWFSLASVDPPSVNCTLMRFLAQWWQDGDTGKICYGEFAGKLAHIIAMDSQHKSSDEVVEALEISVHDFKLEFPTGASIHIITGLNCGFQGIVIGKVDDMCILQGGDQQASHGLLDVLAIFLASHVSLTTYISQEPDNQVLDDPLIYESCIQPGDFICIISGPHKGLCSMLHWHSSCKILITLSTLHQADPDNLGDKGKSRAQEPKVPGSNSNINEGSDLIQVSVSMDEVLIIPPSTLQFSREKGYDVTISDHVQVAHGPAVGIKGLVHSVDFISGCLTVLADDGPLHKVLLGFCIKLENHSLHDIECQLKNTVVITDQLWILQLNQDQAPWPVTPGSLTLMILPLSPSMSWCKQMLTYRCVPWLFDNNFCDYANWHVCLRVATSYNCGLLLNELTGQIHWVKKCQVKKDLKGVQLEDGTKLPLGDVCQVIPTN
ncbi:hypothetical protein EDC04DRAFT_2598811 [Pisolithus marmoratus]|nr:hypothetical protein EDC04DRAFT_2598811 [Pisolithus marmoratus]